MYRIGTFEKTLLALFVLFYPYFTFLINGNRITEVTLIVLLKRTKYIS